MIPARRVAAIAFLVAGIVLFQLFPVSTASPESLSASSQATSPVPLAPPLSADFTFSPTRPVVGETVTFNATARGGAPPYNYSWDFGDRSTAENANVTHAYASAETFPIVLTVNDTAGNFATVTKFITVTEPLTADFSFLPTRPATGESVSFTATASGGSSPYTYAWTFDDGGTGSGNPVSHTYTLVRTFTVGLTVSDSASHVATQSKPITVTAPLTADFTFSPAHPVIGQTVSFVGTATGGTSPYAFAWTFGDGGTAAGATVSHAFASSITYTVTLTVSDFAGHVVTVSKSVPVTTGLVADFSFSPLQPVVGEAVSFTATAAGGTPPHSYAWTFGDRTTGTGALVSHAYASPGTYTVTLTVSDSGSLTAAVEKSVPVTPPLIADFTFSPTEPAAGDTISFNATATGGTTPYSFAWNFGDGGTASGELVTHVFASDGTFTVTLMVSDSAGHDETVPKPIAVIPGLATDFTFSPSRPAIGDTVSFSATADGGTPPYAFAWDFGDGATGFGTDVAHAYASAGVYTVTLNVTDAKSRLATALKSVPVATELAADFTYTPSQPVKSETIWFYASALGGTPPYTYFWDFGNGATAVGAKVGYTYARAESYNVSLLVTDSLGHNTTVVKIVSVALRLFGDFTFAPTLPLTFERIDFLSISYGGTPPYTFAWDFGDGSTASGGAVNHTYLAAGFYTVSLRVVDLLERNVTATKTISVSYLLAADFTFSQVFPVTGETVTFSAQARGASPPYTFSWNFGDGSTKTGATVSHAYDSAGAFYVTLVVSDTAGHSATVTKPIVVTPPLIADFVFSPTKPAVGENVTFTGTPAGATPPFIFNWTFGDGSNATGASVVHVYTTIAFFTVTVVVSDSAGHNATTSIPVPVTVPLVGNFSFSPFEPVALEEISFSANASGGTPDYAFAWAFGDGSTAERANVTHAYASARSVNVTLTLSDSGGHVLRLVQPISVGPSLVVDLLFSATPSAAGHSFAFSANASGGAPPYAYEWSFGDGASSREAQTNHSYGDFSSSKSYRVVLTVCDSAGRCTSASKDIEVPDLFPAVMIAEVAFAALVVALWVIRRRPRTAELE